MTTDIISPIEPVRVVMYPDGRFDTKNAALYLGLEPKTLAMMRSNGTGPKFVKRGRVFYFKMHLDDWIGATEPCSSTAQAAQRQKELCQSKAL